MSSSNCCFLTCIQVSQESGQVLWYAHLFQNFPQFIVIHTVKGFGIVNKTEIDVFRESSSYFNDPADIGHLISGSSSFSKTSLNIWKFTVQVLLKPGLENFEHYFTSVWDECNCAVVWAFFGIAFLCGMKTDLFQSCFPNLLAYWLCLLMKLLSVLFCLVWLLLLCIFSFLWLNLLAKIFLQTKGKWRPWWGRTREFCSVLLAFHG